MIEITLGTKKYKVPSKLEEVSLRQYQALKEESEDTIEAFSKFSKIPLKQLKKASQEEVLYFISQLGDMLQEINIETLKKDPIKEFKVKRKKFYPLPNVDKQSMGRYLDCSSYMKALQEQEYLFYPYLMAIYCPKKEEEYDFDGDQLEARAELMRDLPVITALTVCAFFLNNSKNFAHDFQVYFSPTPTQTKPQPEVVN